MSGGRTMTTDPAAGATEASRTAGEERRLNLLRQIALAGGTVTPDADPAAPHGYAYVKLGDDVERDLGILARRNYLEPRFFDRVSLCPKCGSHHLNVREICPSCRRAHVAAEGLIHHFRCGYVGIPAEFSPADDGNYTCPKCNRTMHHIGSEFDRLGRAFLCRACGVISDNPPLEALCFACGARTPAENLVSAEIYSYVLTSRGAAAVRNGALLDDDDEIVSIADAPVYRRNITIEFLQHEMRCLQQFKTGLSVLLVECAPDALERYGEESASHWLTRLRGCIRDVDVLGQLADAVFVVILPQTKRRTADALRERIVKELGPSSPFALTTVEIAEQRDLVQLIAGRNTLGK